jgi:prepilin-type N-terminal cleavage/methylation domain-containing protein/prepilin-type processing-associated H-X9-DG protein
MDYPPRPIEPIPRLRPRSGFTLTELLVAIAILAVLIALIMPTFSSVQSRGGGASCLNNLRQLAAAWSMFAGENEGRLVDPSTARDYGWAWSGNTLAAIEQGDLFPYLKDTKVYRCPSDDSNHVRSYSISGRLGAVKNAPPPPAARLLDIPNPAQTLLFIEENDPRGFNMGAWIINGSGPGWIDFCPAWHDNGANMAFVDGHVAYRRWVDPRTPLIKWFYASTPNNPDLQYLQSIFKP